MSSRDLQFLERWQRRIDAAPDGRELLAVTWSALLAALARLDLDDDARDDIRAEIAALMSAKLVELIERQSQAQPASRPQTGIPTHDSYGNPLAPYDPADYA